MALKENMTRITVNIDKDKYEKVKEIATKEGRAVSNYINFLIDKEIKKNQDVNCFYIFFRKKRTKRSNFTWLFCY